MSAGCVRALVGSLEKVRIKCWPLVDDFSCCLHANWLPSTRHFSRWKMLFICASSLLPTSESGDHPPKSEELGIIFHLFLWISMLSCFLWTFPIGFRPVFPSILWFGQLPLGEKQLGFVPWGLPPARVMVRQVRPAEWLGDGPPCRKGIERERESKNWIYVHTHIYICIYLDHINRTSIYNFILFLWLCLNLNIFFQSAKCWFGFFGPDTVWFGFHNFWTRPSIINLWTIWADDSLAGHRRSGTKGQGLPRGYRFCSSQWIIILLRTDFHHRYGNHDHDCNPWIDPKTEDAVDPHQVITHHLPILEGGCQPEYWAWVWQLWEI